MKARPIGTRLWLAPADDERVPDDRITVRINMGLAFGTGEHPTTALCLDWLERHVATGSTMLDYGCGSGILAIAALALGARRAFAVDNDDQALTATRANAALNGVADRADRRAAGRFAGRRASTCSPPTSSRARSSSWRRRSRSIVRPGGRLVLSGHPRAASGARRERPTRRSSATSSRPRATAGCASRRAGMRLTAPQNR